MAVPEDIEVGSKPMASHPLNLALRFLLELAALAAAGFYGWKLADGNMWIVAAIGLPLIVAILWGTFAVPDDPSRSGNAPIPVPGYLRLMLELAIFGFATWALYSTRAVSWSLVLGVLTTLHYILSYDRIAACSDLSRPEYDARGYPHAGFASPKCARRP